MRPIIVLLLAGFAGCSNGTEPVTEASAAGVWLLRSVNGSPMPYRYGSIVPAAVQPAWMVNHETLILTASAITGGPGRVQIVGTWQQTFPVTTAAQTYRYECDWKLQGDGRVEIYPRGATNVLATADVKSSTLKLTWRATMILYPRDALLEFSKQ